MHLFLHGVAIGGRAVLIELMRSHLGPYKKPLLLIVVLQTVQTAAALTLPTINARIIDNGVIPGNMQLHLDVGRGDARLRADPGRVRGRRGLLRQPGRDELRARPAQQPLPPGHRLLGARGRRVRRAVADHAHHERRAAGADAHGDAVHDGGRRADHDRRRIVLRAAPRPRPLDRVGLRDPDRAPSCSACSCRSWFPRSA